MATGGALSQKDIGGGHHNPHQDHSGSVATLQQQHSGPGTAPQAGKAAAACLVLGGGASSLPNSSSSSSSLVPGEGASTLETC